MWLVILNDSTYTAQSVVRCTPGQSTNFENVTGGGGGDSVQGNASANVLIGNGGLDYLRGNDGNDTIDGGSGNDDIFGGSDNDVLTGGLGSDDIDGGFGNDTYNFSNPSSSSFVAPEVDTLTELPVGGIDRLWFGLVSSAVTINLTSGSPIASHTNRTVNTASPLEFENATGGSNNDVITGNALANSLHGFAGNDVINGGDGADNLNGSLGNDTLNGGAGSDLLTGDVGNDVIVGGTGGDTYYFASVGPAEADTVTELAGGGIDTLHFKTLPATQAVIVDLTADVSLASHLNRVVNTGGPGQAANFENVLGGSGNDSITGNNSANLLVGYNGNDSVIGGSGNDILLGGSGNDGLVGGAGDDFLDGAAGTDTLDGGTDVDTCLDGGVADLNCEL